MGMKRKQWAICGLVFLMAIGASQTAYAGSINGNEQSVLSAANGRFERDGVVYAVKPEYISSLRSYLSQDDVDLTAEQAQSAISEIYANVKTGIESGYLVEIGKSVQPEETKPQKESSKENQKSKTVQPEKQAESQGAPIENDAMEESKPTEKVENEQKKKETIAPAISMLELVDKAPPQTYEYLYADTNAFVEKINMPFNVLWVFIGAAAAVIIITAVISLYKKLFTQHQNRKLRSIIKILLAAAITDLSFVLCLGSGLWFGAFQDNAILSRLAGTGYYNAIYDELQKDTSISFALLNIPDQVMNDSITYEKVVIAARQQVENDLSQGNYTADTSILIEPLKSDIKEYFNGQSITMTKESLQGLDLLMERLEGKYTALLKWPFGLWWSQARADFVKAVTGAMVIALFLLTGAQTLLVFVHHYKYRGLLLGAKAFMAGGVLALILYFVVGLMVMRTWNPINPDYMNSFFQMYGSVIWKSGTLVCGLWVLLGLIELVIGKAWKEGG